MTTVLMCAASAGAVPQDSPCVTLPGLCGVAGIRLLVPLGGAGGTARE
jgi:hypothetical protein